MRTRFESTLWITGQGGTIPFEAMSISHLLNTYVMLIQKPEHVVNMLIRDIELTAEHPCVLPWAKDHRQENVTESIRNITSLTAEEATDYALNSPLGLALITELKARGVNLENYQDLIQGKRSREK